MTDILQLRSSATTALRSEDGPFAEDRLVDVYGAEAVQLATSFGCVLVDCGLGTYGTAPRGRFDPEEMILRAQNVFADVGRIGPIEDLLAGYEELVAIGVQAAIGARMSAGLEMGAVNG